MNEVCEKLTRTRVLEMDEILGQKFPVLNDGHIRVIDYMGSDESIVQAARTSYGKGTKSVSDDRTLIRYLMRNAHTTPFEMCELKIHVRVPMDCWRQWIRHRMSSTNEYSTRYSEAIDSQQKTDPGEWRLQSGTNKQGSGEFITEWPDNPLWRGHAAQADETPGDFLSRTEIEFHKYSEILYDKRLEFGVAKEQARKDLPLSTYTEAYWKIDLHNLFHFLRLRMDSHAQLEIRSYANIIGNKIVAKWCPVAWKAFQDYRLNAISLSGPEIAAIRSGNHDLGNKRENEEFKAKLSRMNLFTTE